MVSMSMISLDIRITRSNRIVYVIGDVIKFYLLQLLDNYIGLHRICSFL